MPRYRLTIEYDGGPFVGFQRQDNGPSIQASLERAITAYCGEMVTVHGAGRTDKGVHAEAQVVHFDIEADKDAAQVANALNHHLRPDPVAVLDAVETDPGFHARFDAVGRHYRYRIVSRRAPLTFDKGYAWRVPVDLDADAMHDAAQRLIGKHDFTTFRSIHCQAQSPLKTLDRLDVMRHGEEITVIAEARSFLHHQVRSMVGTLKLVGEGKWTADDVSASLEARDRQKLGLNAPPDGLYLVRVQYPEIKEGT